MSCSPPKPSSGGSPAKKSRRISSRTPRYGEYWRPKRSPRRWRSSPPRRSRRSPVNRSGSTVESPAGSTSSLHPSGHARQDVVGTIAIEEPVLERAEDVQHQEPEQYECADPMQQPEHLVLRIILGQQLRQIHTEEELPIALRIGTRQRIAHAGDEDHQGVKQEGSGAHRPPLPAGDTVWQGRHATPRSYPEAYHHEDEGEEAKRLVP